jgi:molecular chaperone GrpE (heat shock protein)
MRQMQERGIHKWPFFISDAVFVGAAYFIFYQSKLPMGAWQIFFVVVCVAGGACLGIMPFLLEYRLMLKLAETESLVTTAAKIQNLERVADQINAATNHWQLVQEQAQKTAADASGIATRIAAEAKAFSQFLEKANEGEKAHLRLEVEKLRRAESEWLQVVIRMLDHIYALNQGASRSGQPRLIEQLGNFQAACRDAARRVGLTPFTAAAAEPFDAQRHQLVDTNAKVPAGAVIGETLATGLTFQGRLIRPVLVQLQEGVVVGVGDGVASGDEQNGQAGGGGGATVGSASMPQATTAV